MLIIGIGAAVYSEIWNVELSFQANSDGRWQISINRKYNGTMWKKDGKWDFALNPQSELTTTDIYLLGDIIDENIRQVVNAISTH